MPISSPGRPEKLQPPLTKLLRNNVGRRSKLRSSRLSPIFYIRGRRNAAGLMIQTAHEEPSSPQVTCIGQVRAGESSVPRRRRRSSWFMKKAQFLSGFYSRRRMVRRILCKWVLYFRAGYCKKVDAEEDCFSVGRKMEYCFSEKCENVEIRVGENRRNSGVDDDDSCSGYPPRNALILSRCYEGASPLPLGERSCRNQRNDREESGSEELQINIPVCENHEVGESRIFRQESESGDDSDELCSRFGGRDK
ncbi:hypothetical protein C2S51_035269 [Perilla frutescens var. frutescens]|nr:hypothetical protein C2S51_035269 [Perilla frutescens var. frutescens]